jgi:hypothetical protein
MSFFSALVVLFLFYHGLRFWSRASSRRDLRRCGSKTLRLLDPLLMRLDMFSVDGRTQG